MSRQKFNEPNHMVCHESDGAFSRRDAILPAERGRKSADGPKVPDAGSDGSVLLRPRIFAEKSKADL